MSLVSFNILLEKFLQDTISPEEMGVFLQYVHQPENQEFLKITLSQKLETRAYNGLFNEESADEMFEKMLLKAQWMPTSDQAKPIGRRILFMRIAAALVVLSITGISLFFFHNRPSEIASVHKQGQPGTLTNNRAVLTLADGSTVVLDSASSGNIAQQGLVKIIQLNKGQLIYSGSNDNNPGDIQYNTISTPKGSQYQLILTDGTKVWLNTASSLRFPTHFSKTERTVELKGEGYFEVAENKNAPFYVKAREMTIHALGTGFDVMAYDDEQDIHTTLEQGSVDVLVNEQHQLLMPGEQARWAIASRKLTRQKAEISRVTAWKEGVFDFKGADLYAIMRQISRWYDVEVKYQGNLSGIALSGIVSRKTNVVQLMEIIEATERMQFEMKGSVITVMPYIKK